MKPASAYQAQPEQDQEAGAVRQSLQVMFVQYLKAAVDARLLSGIEDEWRLAEDLYAGIDPETKQSFTELVAKNVKPKDGKSRITLNITSGKTRIAASQIVRRVLPGDVRPWEIKPTAVPEFDQQAMGGQEQMLQLADGTPVEASKVAQAAKVMLKQQAERMSDQIEDWLTDSDLYGGKTAYAELRKMIKDGARVGTGVIKGPFAATKTERRWVKEGNVVHLSKGQKMLPKWRTIKVINCFPDPSCGDDIHAGSFFIERDYLTPRQVRDMVGQPGYEDGDLATVLQQGPLHWSQWDDRHKDEREGQTRVWDRSTFEAFYLYADVEPAKLIAAGFQVATLTVAPTGVDGQAAEAMLAEEMGKAMALTSIPIVATMINGRVVKVAINPDERGRFPYRFFRWEELEGRPYGKGVPIQMASAQIGLVAAVRAMFENGGQSAGPQVVYAEGVVNPVDGINNLARNKHWTFTPDETMDDVRKAFGLFTIPSVQEQLFNIIKACQEWADQLANIPLLMQGITSQASGTLGEAEMLEANAASPLLDIAKEYDEVVGPMISDAYEWGMADPEVPANAKGDFQCRAIGASSLIHRDRRALALQNVVAPMANDPGFGLSKERLGTEILRGLQVSPETVQMTDDEKKAAAEQSAPVDPRIEAANIKAQSDQAREQSRRESEELERQFKAEQAERQRIVDQAIAEMEVQIQVLESSNQANLRIEEIRAALADTAMALKTKRDLFAAERQFAVTSGEGRGL